MATNLENRNRYALITGGTSGIGYELARLFATDGYNLILVARTEERLQEVTAKLKSEFSVEVTPMAKDLFQTTAAQEIYEATRNMGIQIDVLVNDAGQGQWGPFIETPLERDLEMIQLNIASLVALTKLFLKDMIARNEGRILQLGSEAGTAPIPLLAVYAATKAFVLSFSAALVNELKDTNITVTALLPGATDTDFFHKAEQVDATVYQKSLLSPEEVAKDGYEALMNGEKKIISGAKTKMHVFMNDLFGQTLAAQSNRMLMKPARKRKRIMPKHEESLKERKHITDETGKQEGDKE